MIEKVKPVGNIIAEIYVIEDPVPAGLVGSQSVAVSALVLAVAMMRDQTGIGFAAAGPHDARILENDVPGVRRDGRADVAVPPDERISNDIGILDRPVRQAAGRDTGMQTVDVDVLDQNVLAVGGDDAV
jgi:hypothetical protein